MMNPSRLPKKIKDVYQGTEISKYISHIVLSILLGLFAGIGGILFHQLLEHMRMLFEFISLQSRRLADINVIFIIPCIGAAIVAAMTRMFPSIAREGGVTSVIKAVIIRGGYIPFKNTLFHLIAPIVSIGSGAPLGPEGPAAKIGSGFGSLMAQFLGLNQRDMKMYTAAGAGAAISAVFNAPIAGVFFGVEVILLNDLRNQALSALIISSVVADVLSRAVLGNHHVFTIPSYSTGSIGEYPFFIVLGVLCGIVSLLFFGSRGFMGYIISKRLRVKNEYLKLLPLGLLFGIVLLKYNQLYGIGYSAINEVLNQQIPLNTIMVLFALKMCFFALFLEAGFFGGSFAPALMLGVLFGYIFAYTGGTLFGIPIDPIAFSLVGMGGVLAGINSIPLTSILLVFEVTNDYRFILPLMLVSIISHLVVVYVKRGSVYALELLREGIDVSRRSEIDLLGKIRVRDLKKSDFDVISHRTPFRGLMDVLIKSRYGDVFVVDDREQLTGVVSLKEIRETILSNELADLLIAGDITIPAPVVAEGDPVSLATQRLEECGLDVIPVVKTSGSRKITGVLTHQDIVSAYNRQLAAWETDQFLVNYRK
jgi:CIC family chloride channel protein